MSSSLSRRNLLKHAAAGSVVAAVASGLSVAAENTWKRGPGMPSEGPNTPKIGAPVNGRDLEKIGLVGPLVGQTLRKLLELVITDPAANSRTGLMETAQSLLDDIRAGNSAR